MEPPYPRPVSLRAPLQGALLSLLLLLSACSQGDDPPPPAVQRLELRPVERLVEDRQPELTASLLIPAEITPWTFEGGEASIAPEEADGERRLALEGPDRKTLSIPGPFDPATFDVAAVQVKAFGEHRLFAQLVRDDWGEVNAEPQPIRQGPEARLFLIEFPKLATQREPFDRLELTFVGSGACVLERGVELISRPPAALLPDPAGPPELVLVGKEWRRATALSSASALIARARVPEHGFLTFAYGLPDGLRLEQPASLRMQVSAPDREPFELDLQVPRSTPQGWQSRRTDLAAFAGLEAEFLFTLLDPDAESPQIALTQPLVCARELAASTVLLVTSDTHRADHLGTAGLGVEVSTPVLDALAARGVLFEDCFSATNVTNPSHIALMTATSPRDTGILNNFSALDEAAPTLAERFAQAGYVTLAATSAPHLGHPTSGLGQGFDRMSFPSRDRDADVTIDALEPWLDDTEGLPLFVWLHLFDAHTPYGPPEPWTAQYWPEDRDPFDVSLPSHDLPEMNWPPGLKGLRDLDYPLALYRGEVTYLDQQLARVLDRPRVMDGIVGVTADHGESFGAHGIYYGHEGLFPDTIHVPLIVTWPGAPTGLRVTTPVRQIDLGPTLLELAGVPIGDFPGKSLLPAIAGEDASMPRFAIAAHEKSAAITSDGRHLVLYLTRSAPNYGTSLFPRHDVQMYDLRTDPKCEHDISGEDLERARSMRTALVRWLTEAPATTWLGGTSEDIDLMAKLEELGYTTSDDSGGSSRRFDPDCSCAECARFR